MPPAIRRASLEDRRTILPMLARAFANDPAVRYFFPDEALWAQRIEAFFAHLFHVRIRGGDIYVAGDGLSASLWNPPGGNRLGQQAVTEHWERHVAAHLTDEELRRAAVYEHWLDAHRPPEPHWYLGVLGTEPSMQGRGLGTAVTRPTLDEADRGGHRCLVDTSVARNVELYRRLGFEAVAEVEFPDGPRMWALVREPR